MKNNDFSIYIYIYIWIGGESFEFKNIIIGIGIWRKGIRRS